MGAHAERVAKLAAPQRLDAPVDLCDADALGHPRLAHLLGGVGLGARAVGALLGRVLAPLHAVRVAFVAEVARLSATKARDRRTPGAIAACGIHKDGTSVWHAVHAYGSPRATSLSYRRAKKECRVRPASNPEVAGSSPAKRVGPAGGA